MCGEKTGLESCEVVTKLLDEAHLMGAQLFCAIISTCEIAPKKPIDACPMVPDVSNLHAGTHHLGDLLDRLQVRVDRVMVGVNMSEREMRSRGA